MAAPALAIPIPPGSALGMVETVGLVAAVEAVDAMLKAADVTLVRQQRVVPGLITHVVVGETAAVRAAVDAGTAAAARVGKVAGSHVIPRPADDVWRRLFGASVGEATPVTASSAPPPSAGSSSSAGDDYDGQTVRALRALARDRDDVALRGRALASASKDDLVAALRRADGAAG